ncbi:HK97 gp10 family phage protein [Selenomonas infelix ATCC 43532]|uniref:HK97 gp10 family phage protein n=1 Tax=Selenomonas infelix ATCC 43532 TaxID=679201 RepID=G5GM44_9FIRM|nr:HK97-gp10 family putative phage morphogenesis protein [Selenomonas infelix]EHG22289.1 HK97 gp10 family phage protein [Selenomonas infelix ATCC 43532]
MAKSIKIFANIREEAFRAMVDVQKYDEKTQKEIRQATRDGVAAVHAAAVRTAPIRATGNLRKGIEQEFDEKTCSGKVRATAPHSHLVEFGTRERVTAPIRKKALKIGEGFVRGWTFTGKMPKKPFMRPAIEKERPNIEARIEKAVKP